MNVDDRAALLTYVLDLINDERRSEDDADDFTLAFNNGVDFAFAAVRELLEGPSIR